MNDEIKKPSFLIYYDNEVIVIRLPDEEAGKLFKSLFPYGKYKIKPDFDENPALAMAFDILSMAIDRDKEKYVKRCSANRENGRKGGRPKKNQTDIIETEKTERLKTKPKKADKDKERDKEKEKDNIPFSYPLKEGDTPSPSADAGEASPFTFRECLDCAVDGKVNLTDDGIQAFYDRMEKDGWEIKGSPVTNLLLAMRGFAKNHKKYQKKATVEKETFKEWLRDHGYDQNYCEGAGDFDEEVFISAETVRTIWEVDNLDEPTISLSKRLSMLNKTGFKQVSKLYHEWKSCNERT